MYTNARFPGNPFAVNSTSLHGHHMFFYDLLQCLLPLQSYVHSEKEYGVLLTEVCPICIYLYIVTHLKCFPCHITPAISHALLTYVMLIDIFSSFSAAIPSNYQSSLNGQEHLKYQFSIKICLFFFFILIRVKWKSD